MSRRYYASARPTSNEKLGTSPLKAVDKLWKLRDKHGRLMQVQLLRLQRDAMMARQTVGLNGMDEMLVVLRCLIQS